MLDFHLPFEENGCIQMQAMKTKTQIARQSSGVREARSVACNVDRLAGFLFKGE